MRTEDDLAKVEDDCYAIKNRSEVRIRAFPLSFFCMWPVCKQACCLVVAVCTLY